MYVTSTPGTQLVRSPGSAGTEGATVGSAGGLGTGGTGPPPLPPGDPGHGTGVFCVSDRPWSPSETDCPLTVIEPTVTCASAEAELLVAVAMVSTTTFEMRKVPMTKFCTSECVVTLSVPSEVTTVWLSLEAPLKGCVPPPAQT